MQIKLGLLGVLAATASATQFNEFNNQHQQVGKVYEHEYVQPNVEETCFSVRPVASCDDQHVASHVKQQRVGFHCLNNALPITKQFKKQADQGQKLPFENKSQDVQAYVEVPVRCVRVDTEEKRLRKETEKQSEQKIHLVQNQDGEEESFLFEHKNWVQTDSENEQSERQHQRSLRRQHQNQQQNGHQLNTHNVDGQDFDINEQDFDSSIDEELDTMQQYSDLINNKQVTMHRVLKMSEDQFERLMEHLKFIAHQNRRSDKWSQQIDQILPNVFAKVAKQFFETTLENQTNSQEEKELVYQEYKDVVKRIYAYAVKQALQMKNLNQIGQSNVNERQNEQYIISKIARNLWNKIQRELTPKQVEEVKRIAENVQQQKPQLDRMIAEETLVGLNKEQMKQLEKQLTKVITAGLKMVNHNIAKNQLNNVSEEYKRFHGQQDEEQFRTQYPKLYQRLNTIEKNVQQWNN